jgi:hypothetical protein
MVKLNFNLAAFSFQRGVAILAKSFASAIVALNADVQNAKDEAFGYQQALEQGGEWIGETDEDGTVIWDQSQILDYEVDVVDEAAQELRKAFALALYHHWERSARLWTQADNWSHEQLVAASLNRGYPIDPRLAAVRDLLKSWPDVFPSDFVERPNRRTDWYETIQLSDTQVRDAFNIVAASGPTTDMLPST